MWRVPSTLDSYVLLAEAECHHCRVAGNTVCSHKLAFHGADNDTDIWDAHIV